MMTTCMNQFANVTAAVCSDTRSSSAACTNEACARFALSKKDALAASFFVIVSIIAIIALIMLLAMRLCRLHAILGLLISLLVWMKWSLAEVHRMQLYA